MDPQPQPTSKIRVAGREGENRTTKGGSSAKLFVSVIFLLITNDHKLGCLKTPPFSSSEFCRPDLCSGPQKLTSRHRQAVSLLAAPGAHHSLVSNLCHPHPPHCISP